MANYYPIPLEEMDEVLRGYRFAPVDLTYRNRPVKEWVYERRLPQSPNHFVRVYTGVQRYGRYAGRSRKVGKDAIRVQVVYRDEKGETLVSQPKRVHRVDGWRENLQKRMNEISSTLPQVEFDTRGEPMTLRKYQGNYFWGSRDYPKYKETKRFASEETVDAESFSAAEDIMNYLDTIWNEHSREIKEYVKNQMAGGGMNRDFDNDSMLNYTEDEWFDYKWELFRKSFEEGAWLTDGYVQAIRLLYVPVGTQIRLDELGNWKNRKADKYGVDGKEITSWIWETIKLQEFYGGGIFGDGDIDHTEGEEGIDFDRIVLNGFFKITDIDWLSTIAFNISSWNQEKELCVINGKPIIDGEIMRNDGPGKDITGFSADEWDIRKVAQYRVEIPDEIDVDWEEEEEEPEPDWEVDWDAESYLERDTRLKNERILGIWGHEDWQLTEPMDKYEYRHIKKFNTPEELHEFANKAKHDTQDYVYVCDFDWYVKRVTNNPIYTLYGHIIPLSNFASGWSDQRRRDDKLVKRYGAPIFVQSPVMGKIMTTLKDVRKISDEKMGQSNSSMVGHGMKGLKMKINPDEDSVLIINMKGLKFAYGKGYFGEFSDIMVLGGLPVKNVVGHRYKKPEYKTLNEEQHWKVGMDREDFKRMEDRRYGRYKPLSIYGRGNVANAEDEEITLKEFDDTDVGPNRMFKNMDDKITFMLRKTSKINRYGDIGCPGCGSIGLFYSEPISKGRKWHCLSCLYEDKIESIKSRGDITLEKYGLLIECPLCEKQIKAYNQDSVNRHMKKCKEESS